MKKTIYCPDIECDSCIKILDRTLEKIDGVKEIDFKKTKIKIEFDETKININDLTGVIKSKGFRASLIPTNRKSVSERTKDFLNNRTKYEIEHKLIRYTAAAGILTTAFSITSAYFGGLDLVKYGWWIFYLITSITFLAAAVWHHYSYRAQHTCMVGMMIGMTFGMQTGMMIGAIIGVTNGFFIGAMTGMILGSFIGGLTGNCCGIMGIMEGIMAGLMGGTMGPMITVMMFNDHVLWFMPIYTILNIIILMGLSYMIFEEVVEDNEDTEQKPVSLARFLIIITLTTILLMSIIIFAPTSIFMR